MKKILLTLCAFVLAACGGGSHDPYSAIPIEKYYYTPQTPSETAGSFVVPDGEILYLDFNSGEFLNAERDADSCVEQSAAQASIAATATGSASGATDSAITNTPDMPANEKKVKAIQKCIQARNRIINDYLRVSDLACRNHIDGIQGTSTALNTGLSITTNVATALATFVTGAVAVKELAAVGNVASSSRSVINEQVYFQAIAPQITRLIREDRKVSRANIVDKMKSSPSEYTLDQALADLSSYHSSCSFAAALEQISVTTAKASVSPSDTTANTGLTPVGFKNATIVKAIQTALKKDDPTLSLQVDGNFGPLTLKALKAYQTKKNLPLTKDGDTALNAQTAAALEIKL